MRWALIALIPAFAASSMVPTLIAQDLDEPPPITPDLAMLAAQEAYTRSPLAESVQLRFAGARSWITFRLASGRRDDMPDATLSLELGDLRVHVKDNLLTAASTRAPDVYFQTQISTLSQEALRQVLPPIPLPQLALARGWRDGDDLTPYITDVRWTDAAWDDPAGLVRVEGASAEGPVTLELDRRSGRLTRLLAETASGLMELTAEPIDPADPAAWAIDTESRRRVDRLSELRQRARPLTTGDQVPDLPLLDIKGQVRSLTALLNTGPSEWTEAADRRLVLILAPLREQSEDIAADPEAFIRAALAGVETLTKSADADETRYHLFAAHLVLFVEVGGFERDAAVAAAGAWGAPAERLLWSPMEMPRLAGVEPVQPAIVVVDVDRRILAVVAQSDAQTNIAARLRPVLERSGAE